MSHTPGPWKAVQREWGYPDVEGGPERRLWEVQDTRGMNIAGCTIYSRDKEDALLIAAAPELLRLLAGMRRNARAHNAPMTATEIQAVDLLQSLGQ